MGSLAITVTVGRWASLILVLVVAAATVFGQGRPQQRPAGAPGAQPGTEAGRQPQPAGPQPGPETPPAGRFPAPPAVERLSKTQHTINVKGQSISYTATAGTLVLKHE